MTTRGMKENEMRIVGDLIDEVLSNLGKTDVYHSVKNKVKELCSGFPLYK
jgi:glycine hydroxymethyltransferase